MFQVQRIDGEGKVLHVRGAEKFAGLEEAHELANKFLEVWAGARITFNGKPILEVFASPSDAWAAAQARACRMIAKGGESK